MKKAVKLIIIGSLAIYLVLFIFYKNGYYERINHNRTIMTEEMILQYEKDLANGVDVTTKNYTLPKSDYSNIYTKISLKISKKLEKTIDSGIKYVFQKINDMVDE